MSNSVPCPHCQSPVDVAGTAAGQFVTCARCGTRFPGPDTGNPNQAPEAAAQSAVFPWWAWLGIGLLCLLLFIPMLDMPGGTRSPTMENYQRIRVGMTYPQVESLLGTPSRMNPQIGHFEWKMADGRCRKPILRKFKIYSLTTQNREPNACDNFVPAGGRGWLTYASLCGIRLYH